MRLGHVRAAASSPTMRAAAAFADRIRPSMPTVQMPIAACSRIADDRDSEAASRPVTVVRRRIEASIERPASLGIDVRRASASSRTRRQRGRLTIDQRRVSPTSVERSGHRLQLAGPSRSRSSGRPRPRTRPPRHVDEAARNGPTKRVTNSATAIANAAPRIAIVMIVIASLRLAASAFEIASVRARSRKASENAAS